MELQEDVNKLVEWANKWQMSFKVDKCSVMHIEHTNMQINYNMSNQQLTTTDQQRDLGIIRKDLKWQKQTEKAAKRPTENWGLLNEISGTKIDNWSSHYINHYSAHISNKQCNSGPHI